jgi:hypothetical protein
MIEVVWGLMTAGSKDDTIIVTVTPQLDNKWYKSEISFVANSSNYAVIMCFFLWEYLRQYFYRLSSA